MNEKLTVDIITNTGDNEATVNQLTAIVGLGDGLAQYLLSEMLAGGFGVEPDPAASAHWRLMAAASQANPGAQFRVATMYRDGDGVLQDQVLSYMWFNLAAAQGDQQARLERDALARDMDRDQVAEAQRLARGWRPLACGGPIACIRDQ